MNSQENSFPLKTKRKNFFQEEFKNKRSKVHCPICLENFQDAKKCSDCNHEVCSLCLKSYVEQCAKEWKPLIRCPHSNCSHYLPTGIVLEILEGELKKKYENFLKRLELKKKNWISCPKASCSGGSFPSQKEFLICDQCEYNFCPKCSRDWEIHQGKSCDQLYQEYLKDHSEEELASLQAKKIDTKQCPQCSTFISKANGCGHIVCTQCKFEFCWICGEQFHKDHMRIHWQQRKNIVTNIQSNPEYLQRFKQHLISTYRFSIKTKTLTPKIGVPLSDPIKISCTEPLSKPMANLVRVYLVDAAGNEIPSPFSEKPIPTLESDSKTISFQNIIIQTTSRPKQSSGSQPIEESQKYQLKFIFAVNPTPLLSEPFEILH